MFSTVLYLIHSLIRSYFFADEPYFKIAEHANFIFTHLSESLLTSLSVRFEVKNGGSTFNSLIGTNDVVRSKIGFYCLR